MNRSQEYKNVYSTDKRLDDSQSKRMMQSEPNQFPSKQPYLNIPLGSPSNTGFSMNFRSNLKYQKERVQFLQRMASAFNQYEHRQDRSILQKLCDDNRKLMLGMLDQIDRPIAFSRSNSTDKYHIQNNAPLLTKYEQNKLDQEQRKNIQYKLKLADQMIIYQGRSMEASAVRQQTREQELQSTLNLLNQQIDKYTTENNQKKKQILSMPFYKEWGVMSKECNGAMLFHTKLEQELQKKKLQLIQAKQSASTKDNVAISQQSNLSYKKNLLQPTFFANSNSLFNQTNSNSIYSQQSNSVSIYNGSNSFLQTNLNQDTSSIQSNLQNSGYKGEKIFINDSVSNNSRINNEVQSVNNSYSSKPPYIKYKNQLLYRPVQKEQVRDNHYVGKNIQYDMQRDVKGHSREYSREFNSNVNSNNNSNNNSSSNISRNQYGNVMGIAKDNRESKEIKNEPRELNIVREQSQERNSSRDHIKFKPPEQSPYIINVNRDLKSNSSSKYSYY